jgi:hypothetical protein
MENNNQLATKFDNQKFIEIISKIPNLTDEDRKKITLEILNDDREVRKIALEKIEKSLSAQRDLNLFMDFQEILDKQGVVVQIEQVIETASGKIEIVLKGGDTKLIIPVLIILGIILIATLVIIFWG